MDKQMIEEMENALAEFAKDLRECIAEDYGGVYYYISAKELYKKGYRKIPEGAVVLTREEHIQMLKDLANSNEIAYLSGYGKGSTETAEKFAERLKAKAELMPTPARYVDMVYVEDIDEILKEITEASNASGIV